MVSRRFTRRVRSRLSNTTLATDWTTSITAAKASTRMRGSRMPFIASR
jgi:hypothetical protein